MPYYRVGVDHQIGKPMIFVDRCGMLASRKKIRIAAGDASEAGRRLFREPETAQADAQAFADFKNRIQAGPPGPEDEEVMLGAAKNAHS